MTGRERFAAAVAFQETDRPPHFEHMSKLAPETFGRDFLSEKAIAEASGKERERLLAEIAHVKWAFSIPGLNNHLLIFAYCQALPLPPSPQP